MIELYEVIGIIAIFGFGFVIGWIYSYETRKGELLKANYDERTSNSEMEKYKIKYESEKRRYEDIRDDHLSLKKQLNELFKVLADDGYETCFKYSPVMGYYGYIHKKRDKE